MNSCLALSLVILACQTPGTPAPDLDQLFQQKQGWIGADGVYSVQLAPLRTLWLFSDTWVGEVNDGKRSNATIVNNSLALSDHSKNPATVSFFIRRDANNKPLAFFQPEQEKTWFWLQAAAVVKGKLLIFAAQTESTGQSGVFSFKQRGQWLIIVSNPHDSPWEWKWTQKLLPNCVFTKQRQLGWGAALLSYGEELFIYGYDEHRTGPSLQRSLVVARAKQNDVENIAGWHYYRQGQWQNDPKQAESLVPQMAPEYSVHFQPDARKFVLTYTENGLSPRILLRTAEHPGGPWSESRTIYECPEMKKDKNLFTYAAKAHPMLSSSKELVVSYVVNSMDFWQVARDATLYWPRFVRVPMPK